MNNELLLLSKNDIPFISAQTSIHQPIISEIALIGEENFFSGCQFLNFSKNQLTTQDRIGLEERTDFEIFMSIMCSKEKVEHRNSVMMLLALLFPTSFIKFTEQEILLTDGENSTRINNTNYDEFKDIIVSMFGLEDVDMQNNNYNPIDARAAKIAEKLQKRKKKSSSEEVQKVAVLSRYVSILAVGEQKDINELMQYTVFQLKDEFKRFQMKQSFDIYIQAKMAGAKDLEDVDNWMDDIHP